MLLVFPNRAGNTAGWLSWALANGYGGRKLNDDVVDAGLTAIFGNLLDPARSCAPRADVGQHQHQCAHVSDHVPVPRSRSMNTRRAMRIAGAVTVIVVACGAGACPQPVGGGIGRHRG